MTKAVLKKFGKHLRQLRHDRGLTQEQLADKCSVDTTYIGRLERGEQAVSLTKAISLAKGLGVSVEELFRGL